MNFEIGKRYWRIKEDGALYDFFIAKGIREAIGIDEGNIYFVDSYYDEKNRKVLTDYCNNPPHIHAPIHKVFGTEQEAIDFLIDRLQKRKMSFDL